ncbi:hypothetical protein D3C85_1243290 [compost metagenome]
MLRQDNTLHTFDHFWTNIVEDRMFWRELQEQQMGKESGSTAYFEHPIWSDEKNIPEQFDHFFGNLTLHNRRRVVTLCGFRKAGSDPLFVYDVKHFRSPAKAV